MQLLRLKMRCLNGLAPGIDVASGRITHVLKVDYRNWHVILTKFVALWNPAEAPQKCYSILAMLPPLCWTYA